MSDKSLAQSIPRSLTNQAQHHAPQVNDRDRSQGKAALELLTAGSGTHSPLAKGKEELIASLPDRGDLAHHQRNRRPQVQARLRPVLLATPQSGCPPLTRSSGQHLHDCPPAEVLRLQSCCRVSLKCGMPHLWQAQSCVLDAD